MVWKIVKSSVKIGCLIHVVFEHVMDVVWCRGPSMEPTIWSDNVVLCDHITPRYRGIRAGDIVISRSVTKPDGNVCKRVKGLPGDFVVTDFSFVRVPTGHVWLEGDNHKNSTDSRTYGPVPMALIRGRVLCRIWPLSDFCVFNSSKS
uniref:Mitochondrial inner membrane protease subunit 1 n=1 Tax=Lygus hesperus TaxID=30085 RepID=A0A0A9XHJ4_LYGHE